MNYEYTADELQQLHQTLYEILGEIARVCDKCHIPYFITGGTAIGAFFWEGIIPWDDDIDIGMTRENYERFLQVAPTELRPQYFLQWVKTDPHVPFYFAKVRKNGTLFCENQFRKIPMHQGIYVDIFPFDRIPDRRWQEMLQHRVMNFFTGCYIAKEIWQYAKLGECDVEVPRPIGWPQAVVLKAVSKLPKLLLYKLVKWSQTWFNGGHHARCKNIATASEWLLVHEAEHPQTVKLGPLSVSAPADLSAYLHHHYTHLRKDWPEEQRVNHRPAQLKF